VAIAVEDIVEALDPDARLLKIARSKGDQEGEGATAYLSPRSVGALTRWLAAAGIREGAVFRRVIVRRYAAKSAIPAQGWSDKAWNACWVPAWEKGREASRARVEYHIGNKALHAGSVTPIFRVILRRAFPGGAGFGPAGARTMRWTPCAQRLPSGR
jgi:hypothetical protein